MGSKEFFLFKIGIQCLVLGVCFSFHIRIIRGAERHHYSTFDVQCSMLDVHLLICWTFIFQNNPVRHKCNL